MWPSRKSRTTSNDSAAEADNPGFLGRLSGVLRRTRSALLGNISQLFDNDAPIDEELVEEVETSLLLSDVGVKASRRIIAGLNERVAKHEIKDREALFSALHDDMLAVLEPVADPLEIPDKPEQPFVVLMVGVNGTGKTTTIGKLARHFRSQGHSVMLAAGDTFRAAAVEQLQAWGERSDVPVVAQHSGADAASVVFDALQSARARGIDVLIADTAGRLHTQDGLMEELKKVVRVLAKLDPTAPHETMLVIDASMGQNALVQARQFHAAVNVSGITLTKLDGTAKGGIVFAIAEELGIPIRFMGVGEGAEDLRVFRAGEFVDALLER
jgi:fused signal recognition particle receptor